MKYQFKINDEIVTLETISSLNLEIEQTQELLETGSVIAECIFDEGNSDGVISIESV